MREDIYCLEVNAEEETEGEYIFGEKQLQLNDRGQVAASPSKLPTMMAKDSKHQPTVSEEDTKFHPLIINRESTHHSFPIKVDTEQSSNGLLTHYVQVNETMQRTVLHEVNDVNVECFQNREVLEIIASFSQEDTLKLTVSSSVMRRIHLERQASHSSFGLKITSINNENNDRHAIESIASGSIISGDDYFIGDSIQEINGVPTAGMSHKALIAMILAQPHLDILIRGAMFQDTRRCVLKRSPNGFGLRITADENGRHIVNNVNSFARMLVGNVHIGDEIKMVNNASVIHLSSWELANLFASISTDLLQLVVIPCDALELNLEDIAVVPVPEKK